MAKSVGDLLAALELAAREQEIDVERCARRDVNGHREPAADRELDAGRFESGDDGAKLFDQVEHDARILAPQPRAYANFITP